MLQRLSRDYNWGYTKAILDMTEIFGYVESDLKYHKKNMTGKLAKELLQCVLDNREAIRDDWDGFIRWNCKDNKFEWFRRSDNG